MERDLICIGCPLGCALHVSGSADNLTVTGNTCPHGESYAIAECTAPVRRFTGTVSVSGGMLPVISVKTAQDVPKSALFAVAKAVKSISITAPVSIGDVICDNIAETGIALVATRNMPLWEDIARQTQK